MVDASMSTAVAIRNPFTGGGGTPKGEGSDGILGQIAANTAMTVQILQAVVTGTPQERAEEQAEAKERRQTKLEAGETDSGTSGRLKGFVKGVGSGIAGVASKLNPFGSGFAFGSIGKLLLAGGGILLIRRLSEELIEPLSNMLQEISDKGFKQKLIDIKDDIKKRLEPTLVEMKLAFNNFMDAIGRSIAFVKSIYTMINDYIMSFDTQGTIVAGGPLGGTVMGDGKLDKEELGFLREDMQKKAGEFLGNFIKGILGEMGAFLMDPETLGDIGKAIMLYGPLALIFGTKGKVFAGATIAGLIIYGVRQTYKNYDQALRASVDEMGAVDMKEFAINFLGGAKNAAGSADAAYRQAKGMGGTGLLVGMTIGSLVPGVGTIIGGVFGAVAGGILGYYAGAAGTDKIRSIVDGVASGIKDFIEDIGNFFTDIANGFRYLVTGRGFTKGYNARRLGSTSELQEELDKEKLVLEGLKRMQTEYGDDDGQIQAAIDAQQLVIDQKDAEIIAAPSNLKQNNIDKAENYLQNTAISNYHALGNKMFRKNLGDIDGDGLDEFSDPIISASQKPISHAMSVFGGYAMIDPAVTAALGENATVFDAFKYYEKIIPKLRGNVNKMKKDLTPRDKSMIDSTTNDSILDNPYATNPNLLLQEGDLSKGTFKSMVKVPPIFKINDSLADSNAHMRVNNNNIIDNSKEGGKSFTINQAELDAYDKSLSAGVVLSDSLNSRLNN